MELILVSIKNWSALFENNRSRVITELRWVPIPNKHDGENFGLIMAADRAAEIYAAWILMLQVASKCDPRGTLIRSNGHVHTPLTLGARCRAPASWFEVSITFLEHNTDWLVVKRFTDETSLERHVNDMRASQRRYNTVTRNVSDTSATRQRREGNRKKERIEGGKAVLSPAFSQSATTTTTDDEPEPPTFASLNGHLFKRELDEMLKHARKTVAQIKEDSSHHYRELTPQALSLIADYEKKCPPNAAERIAEIKSRSDSYRLTKLKPLWALHVAAWNLRINDITKAIYGIK